MHAIKMEQIIMVHLENLNQSLPPVRAEIIIVGPENRLYSHSHGEYAGKS